MTPEQMETKFRRLLDSKRVSPSARKALEDYFKMEVGPSVREHQTTKMNDELGAGSPQALSPMQQGLENIIGPVKRY